MCVCKGGWAVMLEEVGVTRWLTRGRAVIVIPAAKLVFSKSSTATFATHDSSVWAPFQLQLTRTLRHQIFPAIDHQAHRFRIINIGIRIYNEGRSNRLFTG